MEQKMFCFQCEQTAGCSGCTGNAGVCGKSANTAKLQDELTGALIGLAKSCGNNPKTENTDRIIIEGLFTTITNVNFNDETLKEMIAKVKAEKNKIVPDCSACQNPCGNTDDYDMNNLWNDNEDIRSLKSLILFGIRGMAAYAYHAMVLGHTSDEVNSFFYRALSVIGYDMDMDLLLPVVLEVGEKNLICMELLDKANTETFGTPTPTTVPLSVEKGPFIVITGHDLYDLKLLLEQTKDKGINIYTHGEMLPAHAYPELKKYPHLKGNFGTAWQNQQKEFDHLPAPILYTTNCLMPVKPSYADRVFTTEVVSYPEMVHIGEEKDFTPVIEKALELGGYEADREMTGINGGKTVMTGFGHGTVLGVADQVIDAVAERTDSTATVNVTTNKEGTLYYLVQKADAAAPDAETIEKDGKSIDAAEGENTLNIADLTKDGYKVYVVLKDANEAVSTVESAELKELWIKGDLNDDGNIDMVDVTQLLEKLTAEEEINAAVGDINGDGVIDMVDVTLLMEQITKE